MTIPTRLHLWWHERPLPVEVADTLAAWRQAQRGWSVHCWGNEGELHDALTAARLADVHEPDRVRHVANVVRWYLLRTYGGVWVDVDTTPLVPLDELLDSDSPFVPADRRPCPFVIGGPPGHELWTAASMASLVGSGSSRSVSGGHMLARLEPASDLRRYPLAAFTAHDAVGRPLSLPPGSVRYTDHAWATSRLRHRPDA